MAEFLRRMHFRLLLEKQRWLLAAVSLLTLASIAGLTRFQIDVSSRPFFSSDDPATLELESFQQTFPSQESILLAVEFPDTAFSEEAVLHVRNLTDGLSRFPGLSSVWSLVNVDTLAEHLVRSGNIRGLKRYMTESARYRSTLVSEDGRSALLLLSTPATGGNPQQSRDLVRGIRQFLQEVRRADCGYYLSVFPVIQMDFSELLLNDQKTFGALAAVLLSLFIYRLFRTFWGIAVPMLCGGLSLLWTLGLFFATGHKLNLVSSVLSVIILVISVANSIHLINYFLQRFRRDQDRLAALQGALTYALPPCLLATITTGLGFLSLTASGVPAVVEFALFASLGIAISFVLTGSLVPVLLLRWVTPASARNVPLDSGLVGQSLRHAFRLAKNHRGGVLLAFAGCLAFLLFGAARIRSTMDVMASFPEDSPSRDATVFLQRHFIGAHVIDLLVTAEAGDLLTLENIRKLESLDRFLNRQPEVNRSLSALLFVRPYLKNYAEAPDELRRLMNLDRSFRSSLAMMQASQRELLQVFLDPDLRTFRLSLFLNTSDSRTVNRLAARIRDQGAGIVGPDLRLRVTGELLLFSGISTRLVNHLLLSLAQAFGLIFLAIGLTLRSAKMLGVSLAPNLMPIAAFFGVMGWTGIPLTVPTSMLACIVLGLSVDDTVHFLHNYQVRRRLGEGPLEAAENSLTTVGRAMVFTSLILMAGFWIGLLSPFVLVAQFGFLAGIAILVALLSDLILLPVCLFLTEKEEDP